MEAAHSPDGADPGKPFPWLSLDASEDAPALSEASGSLTYGALRELEANLRRQIQANFEPGTLLALCLSNGPGLLGLILASLESRAVVPMPIAPDATPTELGRLLRQARCRHLVVTPETADALPEEALEGTSLMAVWTIDGATLRLIFERTPPATDRPALPAEAALVLHSSGSTGTPKGVVLSYSAVTHIVLGRLQVARIDETTHALLASSLAHSVGLYQALAYLAAGASFELLPSYALPAMAERLNAIRPTHLILVVGAFEKLLLSPLVSEASLASLRFAAAGADRVPQHLQERFHALTGRPLAVSYGMTELSWILFQDEGSLETAASLGRPTPGVEIRLLREDGQEAGTDEIGEIVARSPKALTAYLHDEAGTAERLRDGWVHSGDLARRDESGRYWYAGRISDLICLSSGDLVSPVEVEQAILHAHASVGDCLVVGMPSTLPGESDVPWALVVAGGDPQPIEAALKQALAHSLSAYKHPQRYVFVDALPLRPGGKRSRRAARQWLLEQDLS